MSKDYKYVYYTRKDVASADETCNVTEDVLIQPCCIKDTIGSKKKSIEAKLLGSDVARKELISSTCMLTSGLLLSMFGILSLIWTPMELLMAERLNMKPGLPAFDWWKDPPDIIKMKVYIFNITNAERYLNGDDLKLRMEEIGPIVYSEKWGHENVTFNDNGTMSYTVNSAAIYLPELNTIDMNATIVVPNIPVLAAASYLWNTPFFTKFGFNVLIRTTKSKAIINTTIYNYLHNNTDRIVAMANSFAPSMVPTKNVGIVDMLYRTFTHTANVFIGKRYGHEQFSLIEKLAGSVNVPGYGDECRDTITNASEGIIFNQFITNETVLRYYRKSLCRVTPLYYEGELHKYGVQLYKFTFPNDSYHRTKPHENDCYKGDPILLEGLSDISACYFSFPMAISFPHFLYGDPKLKNYVDGLKPNATKHGSYMYVHPLSGIPVESRGRMQGNLVMRPMKGLHEIFDKFNDVTLPLFWIEYGMDGLPYYIMWMMYFVTNVLPIAQWMTSVLLLMIGLSLTSQFMRKLVQRTFLYVK